MDKFDQIEIPDGFDYQAFLSIDSTNKEALRRIGEGTAKSGLWITAKEQTDGRGRGGRQWVSEPGNLFCSLVYDTGKDAYSSAQLSFVTSLAVRDTVAEFVTDKASVECKWPNDVLVADKKISGILLETYSEQNSYSQILIIGIGINIKHHPDAPLYPTTHLNEHNDGNYFSADIFYILTQKMAYWLSIWRNEGFGKIRKEWLNVCKGQGEMVIVRLPNEEIVGRFIDLDGNGALKLAINNEIRLVHSGDVFFPSKESE